MRAAGKGRWCAARRTFLAVAAAGVFAVLTVPLAASASAPCGPPTQLSGIDVNEAQGSIDFSKVKAAGDSFVYARVAVGTFVDTKYATDYAAAKAQGLKVGAYQYFEPTQDPVAQANTLLKNATVAGGDLAPVLDVETNGGQTQSALLSEIKTWLQTVGDQLAVKPIIYTAKVIWDPDVGTASGLAGMGYLLWAASYGVTEPVLPSEWSNWTLWQWTGTGTVSGVSGEVDEDCLNGTDLSTIQAPGIPAPVNTGLPQVTGTPAVTAPLICAPGSWTGAQPSYVYQWLRDGTPITSATSSAYTVTSADAGHHLSCQVTATNLGGSQSATSDQVTVPGPASASTATPATPASVPPVITSATESHTVWREGSGLVTFSRKRKRPVGTTFSFGLNEQAAVTFAFMQQPIGRKANGRCVAKTRKNRHKGACKRTVTVGKLSFTGHSGINKVVFQGRIPHAKTLKPGRYKLVITAANAAGQTSTPRSLALTIVK